MFYKTEISKSDIDRFWSKVNVKDDSQCWNWLANRTVDGYGKFSLKRNGKTITFVASRLAYLFHNNELNENLFICHRCDNPSCVNPHHLFQGTSSENQVDSVNKKRREHMWGEKYSKLKESDVREIVHLVKAKKRKQIDVARKFNVGKNCVWNIVNKRTWKKLW